MDVSPTAVTVTDKAAGRRRPIVRPSIMISIQYGFRKSVDILFSVSNILEEMVLI